MSSILEEDIIDIKRAVDNHYQANLILLEKLREDRASKEDIMLLVDIISDDFSRSGLDDNDEPNDYGIKLEAVIDKLTK